MIGMMFVERMFPVSLPGCVIFVLGGGCLEYIAKTAGRSVMSRAFFFLLELDEKRTYGPFSFSS